MQRERLQGILGLSDGDISRLCDCGLILLRREISALKPKIDSEKIAWNYREVFDA